VRTLVETYFFVTPLSVKKTRFLHIERDDVIAAGAAQGKRSSRRSRLSNALRTACRHQSDFMSDEGHLGSRLGRVHRR